VDFFARQEQTRRTSRVLVGAFLASFLVCALATTFAVALVLRNVSERALYAGPVTWTEWVAANLGPLGGIMAVTIVVMMLASLYRAASLAGGGGDVARMVGATQVTGGGADAQQQRLVNVVEEMALASGVGVPEIFVLDHEAGINAFAAGTNHSNAAICVTRGALERLERAELQGVIAHEFSHVLNGDMRLNQQLIGLSFGILALSLVGRFILRGVRFARPNRKDGSALAVAVIVAIALLVIGWIGVFLSRLIKAAVSRQREALADASAVQFTREPEGLAGALKKIAAYGARIQFAETEEVAHMLFEHGSGAFGGWFATHPPLLERIKALEPTFDPRDLPKAEPLPGPGAAVAAEQAIAAARAEGGFEAAARTAAAVSAALAAMPPSEDPVRERAGQIVTPEVGGALRDAVPEEIQQAARAQDASLLLVAALAVAPVAPARDRQFALIESQLGKPRALECRRLYESLGRIERRYRLSVIALALPALKRRPLEQIRYMLDLLGRIAALEGEPRLFDYVLLHVLAAYLRAQPAAGGLARRAALSKAALRDAVRTVLATAAAFGNADAAAARGAYAAGIAAIGWPDAGDVPAFESPAATRNLAKLDEALAALSGLRPNDKLKILRGVLATIRADRKVELDEQELFRAIAATLDCPLPPGFAI
jgi:Zn-dependent protease with chaperone function